MNVSGVFNSLPLWNGPLAQTERGQGVFKAGFVLPKSIRSDSTSLTTWFFSSRSLMTDRSDLGPLSPLLMIIGQRRLLKV